MLFSEARMNTRTSSIFRLFAPILCSLLVSCGSEEPEDPLKSANGFCGEWGKAVCVDAIVQDCASGSVEDCQDAQREFCLDRVSEKYYTGTGAVECLSYLRDAYRDEQLQRAERDALVYLTTPCDKLLSGNGKAGDECKETKDCNTADGLECIVRFGETRGQCHEPRSVSGGGRCSSADSVCEDEDQYCDGRNCVAKSIEGEICNAEIPCDDTSLCVIPEGEEEGECQPRKKNGTVCVTDGECRSGLCDRNADETDGLCVGTLQLSRRVDMCNAFR